MSGYDIGAETVKTQKNIILRLKKENRYDTSLDPIIDSLATMHVELKSVRTKRKNGFDEDLIKLERSIATTIVQLTKTLSLVDTKKVESGSEADAYDDGYD